MGARKRPAAKKAASTAGPRTERPSDEPEVLRQLHAENLRKAGEALRALTLPNDVELCVVFKA